MLTNIVGCILKQMQGPYVRKCETYEDSQIPIGTVSLKK